MILETSNPMRGGAKEMQNTMELRRSCLHLVNLETSSTMLNARNNSWSLNLHLPQFRASEELETTKRFIGPNAHVHGATAARTLRSENACFATVLCTKMYETCRRHPRQPAPYKNRHFTSVLDIRRPRNA